MALWCIDINAIIIGQSIEIWKNWDRTEGVCVCGTAINISFFPLTILVVKSMLLYLDIYVNNHRLSQMCCGLSYNFFSADSVKRTKQKRKTFGPRDYRCLQSHISPRSEMYIIYYYTSCCEPKMFLYFYFCVTIAGPG